MPNVTIRASSAHDVAAIAEIYAHYVRHSTATFETEPPDVAEMARRRADTNQRNLPYLVAEQDGVVIGYAYAVPYRRRKAYRFTVEDSIYVHPDHTGQGLGAILLPALVEACVKRGARQMIAVIGGNDNAASIRLHEKFGFRHTGVFQSVGFKFGRWLDTVLMQRALGNGDGSLPEE
jgi:L-amino acid N-acyltransferase YncA